MESNVNVVKTLYNGELHKYKTVIVYHDGIRTTMDIDKIKKIEIYSSGTVLLEETSGDMRIYSNATMYFKKIVVE